MVFLSLFILSHLCVFIPRDNGLALVMSGPRQHYCLFSFPNVYRGVSRPTADNSMGDNKKKRGKISPKGAFLFFSISFVILQ